MLGNCSSTALQGHVLQSSWCIRMKDSIPVRKRGALSLAEESLVSLGAEGPQPLFSTPLCSLLFFSLILFLGTL